MFKLSTLFVSFLLLLPIHSASSLSIIQATPTVTPTPTPIKYNYVMSTNFCRMSKVTNTGITMWSVSYDESIVPCRPRFFALLGTTELYAVFETSSSSTNPKYISLNVATNAPSAFSRGVFYSYGIGSNAYVSVLVKIDTLTGKLLAGTFIMSKVYPGDINGSASYGFTADQLTFGALGVVLTGTSVAYAPNKNSKLNKFYYDNDAYYYSQQRMVFRSDLTEILSSEAIDVYNRRLLTPGYRSSQQL